MKLHTAHLNYLVPLSTSVLLGRKPYSRSTAALRSTGSVDSTGSDLGITHVKNVDAELKASCPYQLLYSGTMHLSMSQHILLTHFYRDSHERRLSVTYFTSMVVVLTVHSPSFCYHVH